MKAYGFKRFGTCCFGHSNLKQHHRRYHGHATRSIGFRNVFRSIKKKERQNGKKEINTRFV